MVLTGIGSYDGEADVFTIDGTIGACTYIYQRSGEEYRVDSDCE